VVASSALVKHPAMNLSQLVPISTVAETSSSKDWEGVGPREIKEALSMRSPSRPTFVCVRVCVSIWRDSWN